MDLVGKWAVEKESGLVAAMQEMGIPQTFINLSDDIGLQLEITKDGDAYTVKQQVSLKLNEYKFKPGQKFDAKNWLGQQMQGSVSVQSNNKMVENITEGGVSSSVTIQKVGSNLVRTRDVGGVKCTLTYTKL